MPQPESTKTRAEDRILVLIERSTTLQLTIRMWSLAAFVPEALLLLLVLFLRFESLQVIVLPLWVDSVHHSAIVRLILAQGGLPETFRPFADVDVVNYHVGYHLVVAILSRLTGLSVEQTMLWFGQAMQVLVCAGVYALVSNWTGRRSAGLLAMLVPGTLSLMPAYYLTWGRYTQLAGLVILPLAMLAYAQAAKKGSHRHLIVAGAAAAALFWVHYRVTIFFGTFVLAFLAVEAVDHRETQTPVSELLKRTLQVFLITFVLSLPWLWRLWTTLVLPIESFPARILGTGDYNAVPLDLLVRPGMAELLVVALIGGLLAVCHGGRFGFWSVVVLLWVALTALLLNPSVLGGSPTWIVNNASALISLFVPEAILIGLGFAAAVAMLPAKYSAVAEPWLNVGVLVLAVVSAPLTRNVINPVTVLADQNDVEALDWIRRGTPPDAVFLVNERFWQGNVFVGTDGGYWIPNLTGRRTTMPIAFYAQGASEYVDRVNSLARMVEAGPDPDAPMFRAALSERGVTHVYIGAKGGPLPLDKLLASRYYRILYSNGAAHVFAVLQ